MNQLPILSDLFQEINEKCDTHDLYDSASYELQGIRSKISSTNQRIRQNLDRIVKSQANQKKLSDAIITVRNDRNVIPVKVNIAKISKDCSRSICLWTNALYRTIINCRNE